MGSLEARSQPALLRQKTAIMLSQVLVASRPHVAVPFFSYARTCAFFSSRLFLHAVEAAGVSALAAADGPEAVLAAVAAFSPAYDLFAPQV